MSPRFAADTEPESDMIMTKTAATSTNGNLPNSLFFIFIPLVIIVSSAILACLTDLRLDVPLLVGLTAFMAVMATLSLYLGDRGMAGWSPAVILGVALLLRLMFLFAPPQLSDDIYRYLWDGATMLNGASPYAAAPSAAKQVPRELAPVLPLVNHPHHVTIYPPAAQLVFAAGAATGGGITGLKGVLVLFDLALCGLLILLLNRLGLPSRHAVLYAWNPLPVLEIAASGHVDGAGMFFFIAACCLLVKEPAGAPRKAPYLLAGALLAFSGLVKLFPLVFFPALLLLVPAGRRRHFSGAFLGTAMLLLAPFFPHLANLAGTLNSYARHWEFAGFAFGNLRGLTGSGTAARMILGGVFLLYLLFRYGSLRREMGRQKVAVQEDTAATGRLALAACYDITMAFLLLTPTLQPWYALALAALLPLAAGPAGIVLCWAVLLTYRVQIPYFILGQWLEDPRVTAAVFLAPVTAYLLSRALRGVRAAPA